MEEGNLILGVMADSLSHRFMRRVTAGMHGVKKPEEIGPLGRPDEGKNTSHRLFGEI